MKHWVQYFEHNRVHRLPIPWEQGLQVEPALREPLICSLQRFQVGESGEGRHLRQQATTVSDACYERADHGRRARHPAVVAGD